MISFIINREINQFKIYKIITATAVVMVYIFVVFLLISQDITNFSNIRNILYYYNSFYKLLKMTWSIINTKVDKSKKIETTAIIAIIIIVYFLSVFIKFQILVILPLL